MTHSERELIALETCNTILEGVQTYTRGATNVKEIRVLISKRIDELSMQSKDAPTFKHASVSPFADLIAGPDATGGGKMQ